MACSIPKISIRSGQFPVDCGLCACGKIQFKCQDCSLLLCRECIEGVHRKFGSDHRIINLHGNTVTNGDVILFRDIRCSEHNKPSCLYCKTCEKHCCPTCISKIHTGHTLLDEEDFHVTRKGSEKVNLKLDHQNTRGETGEFELKLAKECATCLRNIHCIASCSDESLFVGDDENKRIDHVNITQHNAINIQSSFRSEVYHLAVTSTDDILISVYKSNLGKIVKNQSKVFDSCFSTTPLLAYGIHVTSDNKVIISARSPDTVSPRSVVMVMDQKGKLIKEHEFDRIGNPLFNEPDCVTSASNGNIYVTDSMDGKGRVVILGDIISIYEGQKDIPFTPCDIATAPCDKIFMTDANDSSLHILTCMGTFISYFKTESVGITEPYSIAFSKSGRLFIGCVSPKYSSPTFVSKLYELKYTGC